MPMHNSQTMLAHIPVLVATDIPVMIMLVKTSTKIRQPCLVANVVISKVNSFQPNYVSTVATTVMPMFPVPKPSVLGLAHVIPDMMVTARLLGLMSAHVTPDTGMMDRPVLRMMNVTVVTTLVTPPSSHVPILTVHTNARVTKGTKETVWSMETSRNAPTILAMPMLIALTMLARLSSLHKVMPTLIVSKHLASTIATVLMVLLVVDSNMKLSMNVTLG